jgi:hypothetical protein
LRSLQKECDKWRTKYETQLIFSQEQDSIIASLKQKLTVNEKQISIHETKEQIKVDSDDWKSLYRKQCDQIQCLREENEARRLRVDMMYQKDIDRLTASIISRDELLAARDAEVRDCRIRIETLLKHHLVSENSLPSFVNEKHSSTDNKLCFNFDGIYAKPDQEAVDGGKFYQNSPMKS